MLDMGSVLVGTSSFSKLMETVYIPTSNCKVPGALLSLQHFGIIRRFCVMPSWWYPEQFTLIFILSLNCS